MQHAVGLPLSQAGASCVVDTNVLVDIYTCSDLADAYDKAGQTRVETPETLFRRIRARESLLLAILLHETNAKSLSLEEEGLRMFVKRAPPDERLEFGTHFTTWFIHFVKDFPLSRWTPIGIRGADQGLKGSGCDDLLLEVCLRERLPLVTNEGYSLGGVSEDNPKNLRAKARKAGVDVFTPREYWTGRFNPARASRRFLNAFDRHRRAFLKRHNPLLSETLQAMFDMYRLVLFGVTGDPCRRLSLGPAAGATDVQTRI